MKDIFVLQERMPHYEGIYQLLCINTKRFVHCFKCVTYQLSSITDRGVYRNTNIE